jgi:hydroxyacyl-ACP dehydratase HTD2-like protein with hotdog domain
MAENAAVTDEMKKWIGRESESTVIPIEKFMVKKFAIATDDNNPLWQEEEYVKKAKYSGIPFPPNMLCCSMISGGANRPMPPHKYERRLDGGAVWDFYKPIMVGDTLTNTAKLVDIKSREGKMGTMLFFVWEISHVNQRGELVAKTTSTGICY